ncbi:MAG: hypothetical protein WC437_04610 [Patescibacteria group bacterium]
MTKQEKLKQAIRLQEAMKTKQEAFVLLEVMDKLNDKIENIKPTDLSKVNKELENLKNEEIVVELDIV